MKPAESPRETSLRPASPVIGPLVVCCAYCQRNEEKRLRSLCSKDSKQLSPKQREETLDAIKGFCSFRWVEVSAADLNRLMRSMSLNDIEAMVMSDLIKQLNVAADIMIDMPDRYGWTFRKRMEKFKVSKFEAEHKADETYPIVAAASIYAKVLRDRKISEIHKAVGDFGSGYPGDVKTSAALRDREFLARLKPFLRERWKTLENLKQKKLFGEGESANTGE